MSWALPHQSTAKKCHPGTLAGQFDRAMFSHEVSASQMTLVCVMLTKTNQGRPQSWLLGWKSFLLLQATWDAGWLLWSMNFFVLKGFFVGFFFSVHIALVFVYLFVCFSFWSGSFWTLLSGLHGQFLTAWKSSFRFFLVSIKLISSKQSNNKSHTIENISTGFKFK